MKNLKYLAVSLLFTTPLLAQDFDINKFKIDEKETNKKLEVKSKSGKKSDVRAYESTKSEFFSSSLKDVLKGIENFTDKCNNDYKDKREFSDKKINCPIYNKNLIESRIIKIDNSKMPLEKNEQRHYLIERNIYNRQNFHHYDLVRIYQAKNERGQKTITVKQRMLDDKEVSKLIEKFKKRESVFLETYGEFVLTEISKAKTMLDYRYYTETDHWLLNKSISVSEVFEGTAKGLNSLFEGIKQVAEKKELASKSEG